MGSCIECTGRLAHSGAYRGLYYREKIKRAGTDKDMKTKIGNEIRSESQISMTDCWLT